MVIVSVVKRGNISAYIIRYARGDKLKITIGRINKKGRCVAARDIVGQLCKAATARKANAIRNSN